MQVGLSFGKDGRGNVDFDWVGRIHITPCVCVCACCFWFGLGGGGLAYGVVVHVWGGSAVFLTFLWWWEGREMGEVRCVERRAR